MAVKNWVRFAGSGWSLARVIAVNFASIRRRVDLNAVIHSTKNFLRGLHLKVFAGTMNYTAHRFIFGARELFESKENVRSNNHLARKTK